MSENYYNVHSAILGNDWNISQLLTLLRELDLHRTFQKKLLT